MVCNFNFGKYKNIAQKNETFNQKNTRNPLRRVKQRVTINMYLGFSSPERYLSWRYRSRGNQTIYNKDNYQWGQEGWPLHRSRDI